MPRGARYEISQYQQFIGAKCREEGKKTRVARLHGRKIQEEERECTQRNRIYRPTIFGAPCREDMHVHVLRVRRM